MRYLIEIGVIIAIVVGLFITYQYKLHKGIDEGVRIEMNKQIDVLTAKYNAEMIKLNNAIIQKNQQIEILSKAKLQRVENGIVDNLDEDFIRVDI
jgi:hypothetical protein